MSEEYDAAMQATSLIINCH